VKIGVPVGQFHRGNTGEYVVRALQRAGHSAEILSPKATFEAIESGRFNRYIGVDSGETVDFKMVPARIPLRGVGFWFIDFRHNKDRQTRLPTDMENARLLAERGGWVFQSQFEDVEYCHAHGITRCSWLPLAADPEVWCDRPVPPKRFHLGFAGNVWDRGRADALQLLLTTERLRIGFNGHGGAWMEDGAALLRESIAGFNISSYYGEPYAFDVNMRVFETLSCGVPLVTNFVPSLGRLFPPNPPFIRTFDSLDRLLETIAAALHDPAFRASGAEARAYILEHCTYSHRMEQALAYLSDY
jgi:hypothetical protein